MTDGIAASRQELEAKKRRNLDDIAATDAELAELEPRVGMLRDRRAMLQAAVDSLDEGIRALKKAERDVVATEA